jgi:hypothetical protein
MKALLIVLAVVLFPVTIFAAVMLWRKEKGTPSQGPQPTPVAEQAPAVAPKPANNPVAQVAQGLAKAAGIAGAAGNIIGGLGNALGGLGGDLGGFSF